MIVVSPTFDWICARLTCPRCGEASEDPCAIDLQTRLARSPHQRHLRVGDGVALRENPEEGGYLRVRGKILPARLRVIEAWSCPQCGASFLWARLHFEAGTLAAVDAVPLDEPTLAESDYITGEALQLAPLEPRDALTRLTLLEPAELRRELARLEAVRLEEKEAP